MVNAHDQDRGNSSTQDGLSPAANTTEPAESQAVPSEPRPSQPSPGEPSSSEPIPRLASTKRLITVILGIVVVLYLGSLVGPPIGAGLHKVWAAVAGSEQETKSSTGGQHYYTCGMHPWVIVPHPGDCPICGMKLVPLDPAKFSGQVTISPVVAQNIGVRVEKVQEGSGSGSIRTVGTVTPDETLLGDVNVKVSGWIERLYVDYLGAPVRRGQPLFELYSPDLYAAQGEYLLAYKATQRAADGGGKLASGFGRELLEPARTKLSLYDIGAAQIKALEARGKPRKTMTIVSPQKGVVTEKHAFEGMNVTPGMTAFRIADLSRVWVMATLYEYQSRDVKVGQPATMTLTYLPGQKFEGKVVYIYPFLDEKTRQINVRLEFPNPDLTLKPGMYTTVVFDGTSTNRHLSVSRSAVIDTGERQVAFVARGEGRFEPRKVSMGAETDDGKVEILSGLEPGELVVTSGQFLIDSEARMREALARMMKGAPVAGATAPKAPETESAAVALPDAGATALGAALDAYLAVGQALAKDTTANIGVSARKLAEAIDALVAMPIEGQPHFWRQHPETKALKEHALKLAAPSTLAEARSVYASLSAELSKLLHATGIPKAYGHELQDFHCPMYPQGKEGGSVWVQPAGTPRNPYFGSAMLTCSDWQRPFEVGP
jgi:Cu(I)/Ag(I) efflux system membrane fusion protein